MKLIAVPDEDAIARYSGKLPPRSEGCAHDNAVIRFAFSRRHMQKLGQTGAKVRWEAARKRRRAAQRAAQAQWAGMTAEERSAWARKLYHARAKAREGNGKANG
jgi:acyl-CoA reductase-like NAD-dependent aldehyde dehydrogenase